MKYGYFNYNPVGPSVFFYTDDNGTPLETQYNIEEPTRLVEAVSSAITYSGIDHVVCNAAGLELSPAIKQHLNTQFSNYQCEFELNK